MTPIIEDCIDLYAVLTRDQAGCTAASLWYGSGTWQMEEGTGSLGRAREAGWAGSTGQHIGRGAEVWIRCRKGMGMALGEGVSLFGSMPAKKLGPCRPGESSPCPGPCCCGREEKSGWHLSIPVTLCVVSAVLNSCMAAF